jgi:hypothetical protein
MDGRKKNFAYVNNLMSKESISLIYDANNVKYDKCQLYGDFVMSLIKLIYSTYLGDDVTDEEDRKKHFEWCWKKNVSNFEKEGIYIDSYKLSEYFFEFMFLVFYLDDDKDNEKIKEMDYKLWTEVFDCNKLKTNSEVDAFIEIYNLFEKSVKKNPI